MTHEITTFGARRQCRLIAVVNVLDTEVCDLQHPAAVNDAVARLEVAVNFHWTQMQISHTLQNVQKNFDTSVSCVGGFRNICCKDTGLGESLSWCHIIIDVNDHGLPK